jgi:hypothetical protein
MKHTSSLGRTLGVGEIIVSRQYSSAGPTKLTTDDNFANPQGPPKRRDTFRRWLARRRKEDSAIGDFAFYVLRDLNFRSPRTWKALEDYLFFEAPEILRSHAAHSAGRKAWECYRAERAQAAEASRS